MMEDIDLNASRIRNGKPRYILLEAVASRSRASDGIPEAAATKRLCAPKKLQSSSSSSLRVPVTPLGSEKDHYEEYVHSALWQMGFCQDSDCINRWVSEISSFFLETVSIYGVDVGFTLKATMKIFVANDEFDEMAVMNGGGDDGSTNNDVIDMDERTPREWYVGNTSILRYSCADEDTDDYYDDDDEMYSDDDDHRDYDAYGDEIMYEDDDGFDIDPEEATMTSSCVVPREVMEALRRDGKVQGEEDLEGKQCIVCLQEYSAFLPGSDVLKLPCTHLFHDLCISEWL